MRKFFKQMYIKIGDIELKGTSVKEMKELAMIAGGLEDSTGTEISVGGAKIKSHHNAPVWVGLGLAVIGLGFSIYKYVRGTKKTASSSQPAIDVTDSSIEVKDEPKEAVSHLTWDSFISKHSVVELPDLLANILSRVPAGYEMAMLMFLLTALGALCFSKVRSIYLDGKIHAPNLMVIIEGNWGSGKEKFNQILHYLFRDIINRDKSILSKDGSIIQYSGINATASKFIDIMANNQGVHMFSFSSEILTLNNAMKKTNGLTFEHIRKAFDNGEVERQNKSKDIQGLFAVFLNAAFTGTPGDVTKFISKELEGGSASRFIWSTIPDPGRVLESLDLPEDDEIRMMRDQIMAFFSQFGDSIWSSLLFLVIGSILTLCVQSSAAMMAITMILCSTGVMSINQGIMLVLGENIGTTITANIAALGANVQARRAALAHFTYNIIGVIWSLCLLKPFVGLVCNMAGFDQNMTAADPGYEANLARISVVLAGFHSAFNITNTAILIWFIPQIEKLVCAIIKPRREDEEDDFKLHFITSGIMKTPELSVLEAQKEIKSFGERIQSMFGMVRTLLDEEDKDKFVKLYSRIEKYEEISDQMETDIANYLHDVSDAHLSDETKAKMRAMLREISEIESIGDSCYKIARIINRYRSSKDQFSGYQIKHIKTMMDLVDNSLTEMNKMLVNYKERSDINRAYNIENEIDNYRDMIKTENFNDVNEQKYSYAIGTMYSDIFDECETVGDYVLNVVETRMGVNKGRKTKWV